MIRNKEDLFFVNIIFNYLLFDKYVQQKQQLKNVQLYKKNVLTYAMHFVMRITPGDVEMSLNYSTSPCSAIQHISDR